MSLRPCFVIGTTDYISFIKMIGFKWEVNDVDSPDSGRTLDGLMHRSRVAQKRKLNITLNRLTTEEFRNFAAAIEQQYVTVRILDPKAGGQVSYIFYGSTISSAIMHDDGVNVFWGDGQFSLIER